MRVFSTCVFVLVTLLPKAVLAEDDGVRLGFVTGTAYRGMAKSEQQTWMIGAMDGIMAESLAVNGELFRAGALASERSNTAGKGYEAWFGNCVETYDYSQIKAIFEKRLEQNPESWHAPAALLLRDAAISLCKPISMPNVKVSK